MIFIRFIHSFDERHRTVKDKVFGISLGALVIEFLEPVLSVLCRPLADNFVVGLASSGVCVGHGSIGLDVSGDVKLYMKFQQLHALACSALEGRF